MSKFISVVVLFLFSSVLFSQDRITAVQHNGFEAKEYFYCPEKEGICTDVESELILKASFDRQPVAMVPFGQSDIALFDSDGTTFYYNTITSQITELKLPESFNFDRQNIPTSEQIVSMLEKTVPEFGIINYLVLGVYLFALVLMGFYFF